MSSNVFDISGLFIFILFSFSIIADSPAIAQGERTVVILEGNTTSYDAHHGQLNYKILQDLFQSRFNFNKTPHFDVENAGKDGHAFLPRDVISLKPALVIVHLSVFKPNGQGECAPLGNKETRACLRRAVATLEAISKGLEGKVKFIIYSRAQNLCVAQYLKKFRPYIRHDRDIMDSIGFISVSKIRGKDLTLPVTENSFSLLLERLLNEQRSNPLTLNEVSAGVCFLAKGKR